MLTRLNNLKRLAGIYITLCNSLDVRFIDMIRYKKVMNITTPHTEPYIPTRKLKLVVVNHIMKIIIGGYYEPIIHPPYDRVTTMLYNKFRAKCINDLKHSELI